eukprot:279793_1
MSETQTGFKRGDYIASGILATCGYFRECESQLNLAIPTGIANICAHFVDIHLSYFLPTKNELMVTNHKHHSTQKVTLMNNRWECLNKLEKRLLMDTMILDKTQFITELECTPQNTKTFGINGCIFLKPFLENCANINYINLSNCNLDNECIKIICQSLLKNTNNKTLLWLDLSNNKIDDKSVEMLIPLLNKLSALHLKNTKISTKSLILFRDYFIKYGENTNCWFIDLQNNSIKGKQWKTNRIDNNKDLFVTKKANSQDEWTGIWKSSYGPHGYEYQLLQIVISRCGKQYLQARKITGDKNVTYGKVTWYIEKVPEWPKDKNEQDIATLEEINGEMQIRKDIDDIDGFSWDDMFVRATAQNLLSRVWYWAEYLHRVIID